MIRKPNRLQSKLKTSEVEQVLTPINMITKLSIIIISYNTCDILRDCLNSLISSNILVPHKIIIVDNASTDGSPDMVATDFKQFKLIRNSNGGLFITIK